ncbi:hypothetical protein ACJMK2_040876, partial [Sinanodonta woodiana]
MWCVSVVISQYEPYGENVAYSKATNQSTTLGVLNASLGVDGNVSTKDGACSHTGVKQTYSWWTVDLAGFYFIKFIRIYQWTRDNVNRLNGSQMYAKGTDNTWKQINFNSNWPSSVFNVSVDLNKPIGEIMLNNSVWQGEAAFICVCELQAFTVTVCELFLNIPNNSREISTPGIAGNNTYNATITVECNEGYNYSLHEMEPLRCASDGSWRGNLGNCNGNSVCGKSGHWNGDIGLCKVIDCGSPLNTP